MIDDNGSGRSWSEPSYSLQHDIGLIRRDMMVVLQDTADVRASMSAFSSRRPIASKRFVVVIGVLCLVAVASIVAAQEQLRLWFSHIR